MVFKLISWMLLSVSYYWQIKCSLWRAPFYPSCYEYLIIMSGRHSMSLGSSDCELIFFFGNIFIVFLPRRLKLTHPFDFFLFPSLYVYRLREGAVRKTTRGKFHYILQTYSVERNIIALSQINKKTPTNLQEHLCKFRDITTSLLC